MPVNDRIQEYMEAIADTKVRAVMQEIVIENEALNSKITGMTLEIANLTTRVENLEA